MAKRVAYLGIKGANSEQAAREFYGEEIEDVMCLSFNQIFEALEKNEADYGILPIENSLAGTVSQSYELLTEHEAFQIQGEIVLHIEHALLGIRGASLEDIQEVRSHPQALAQCADFLRDNKMQAVNWYNTAGAAQDLAAKPTVNVGVIASPRVASMYNLKVLARNVQDIQQNFTRFFALGHGSVPRAENNKTSLLFSTKHEPGALVNCLMCFARHGINLTKLESRPMRDRPWEYLFYTDLDGHTDDENFKQAMADLEKETALLKILGSYPSGTMPSLS